MASSSLFLATSQLVDDLTPAGAAAALIKIKLCHDTDRDSCLLACLPAVTRSSRPFPPPFPLRARPIPLVLSPRFPLYISFRLRVPHFTLFLGFNQRQSSGVVGNWNIHDAASAPPRAIFLVLNRRSFRCLFVCCGVGQ